jgi:tetratricopeptide (TPR) repeat protein
LSTRYLLAGALSRLPEAESRELAIDQCQIIEELAPDYADTTFNLGQLHIMAGQTSEAIAYLRRAVEINPYNLDRRIILAAALHETGHDDEALQQLNRILQQQPPNLDALDLRRRIQSAPQR